MSMVDNVPTEFSDDANLLNVAISRAKTHLCIVTNGNEIPKDTNLAQLIAYIQYNNNFRMTPIMFTEQCDRSIFEYFYT